MALETLKGVAEIGGFGVCDLDDLRQGDMFKKENGDFDWDKYDEYRKSMPISIADSQNMISFRIQNGPIKEVGQNGCQVLTMIQASYEIISKLNEKFPCCENYETLNYLNKAIEAQNRRTQKRIERNVEGYNIK